MLLTCCKCVANVVAPTYTSLMHSCACTLALIPRSAKRGFRCRRQLKKGFPKPPVSCLYFCTCMYTLYPHLFMFVFVYVHVHSIHTFFHVCICVRACTFYTHIYLIHKYSALSFSCARARSLSRGSLSLCENILFSFHDQQKWGLGAAGSSKMGFRCRRQLKKGV
jgi:hypothetical protein